METKGNQVGRITDKTRKKASPRVAVAFFMNQQATQSRLKHILRPKPDTSCCNLEPKGGVPGRVIRLALPAISILLHAAADSALAITPPPPELNVSLTSSGDARLRFHGEPGALVSLESSSDLVSWHVEDMQLAPEGTVEWMKPPTANKRFYRGQVITGPSAELTELKARIPKFSLIQLPDQGSVTISMDQGLSIDDLRGVTLDENPPVLGKPASAYPKFLANDCQPGQEPYVAKDIAPFRFRYFNNEFNYGGWHTAEMTDYASAHGFSILFPYARPVSGRSHLPEGTQWISWHGINWDDLMSAQGISPGRYDLLNETQTNAQLSTSGSLAHDPSFQSKMIDIEYGWLSPEVLRQQGWYTSSGGTTEKQALEQRYYSGYELIYRAPVEIARSAGWNNLSIYGWEPFANRWFGLETANPDPSTDFAWNTFGRRIYDVVDIINPSLYCYYWSVQNVAYTLANLDFNFRFIDSRTDRKPVRPYYWNLLHGGGGGWRWWREQALPSEDVRAMTGLAFFTGIDGLVNWNWSDTGSHVIAMPLAADTDHVLKDGFSVTADGNGSPTVFFRYDAIHITNVTNGIVEFQRIDKSNLRENHGILPGEPTFHMADSDLKAHVRPLAEPVGAVVEGLAMARVFEFFLKHGQVKADISSQLQFRDALPVIRRIKLGPCHVVATFDPKWSELPSTRRVLLTDFAGQDHLDVSFPADRELRIFVLKDGMSH